MTNSELTANVHALEAHGLTALFERIADTGYDGLRCERDAVAILRQAGLVKYARGHASLTAAGWSVSIRIAALRCSAAIEARGPGHWRTAA